MRQYLELMRDVLDNGVAKGDRTGTGTLSVFGRQMRFDLSEGFPLLTTKKVHFKSIAEELMWFMRGETNTNTLNATIWNEWADENGDLGPVYGKQWRSWHHMDYNMPKVDTLIGLQPSYEEIDQLQNCLDTLKNNPDDRRMIVCSWNVGEIDEMALPPCHLLFQFYVANDRLSLQVYQRSCDLFLGVPFNIASYALLVRMMAKMASLEPGEVIWTGGDVHIYKNHMEQVETQLSRSPRTLPSLEVYSPPPRLEDWRWDDFQLFGYDPHPGIKAPVAV